MSELPQRFTVKLFVAEPARLDRGTLIPVFHRWIEEQRLGRQLIDVTDYTHVPLGPGVMLVAHEAHYRLDDQDGRLGLLYARKRSLEGDLPARLQRVLGAALEAAVLLEEDAGLRFCTDELEIGIEDRLLAPNDDATLAWLRPALEPLLGQLFAGAPVSVARRQGAKLPFALAVTAGGAADIASLLARLGPLPREVS
jgi:hypothetical protein